MVGEMTAFNWADKLVLVTGGAGFVGSHLVERLVAAGANVKILDIEHNPANLAAVRGSVVIHTADIRSLAWSSVLSHEDGDFDVIFHLAASAYVPPSVEDPLFDYRTNFAATLELLEALRQRRWPGRLVFASSGAVYGNPSRLPINEDDVTIPVSPYGVGKLAAERYAAVYAQLYGLRISSMRLFSVYGPRHRKQVVWDLMEKIATGEPTLPIHGDGTQVRDFVYVEDVVGAAMVIASEAEMAGEVYNVASGGRCTIDHLATTLCQLMGAEPTLAYTGLNRPGDPERLTVNIRRLHALGYVPQWKLADGLAATVEWFKETR